MKMTPVRFWRVGSIFPVACLIGLVGCGMVINQPQNQNTTNPPSVLCPQVGVNVCALPAQVTWQPSTPPVANFHATLDGVDQTSAFSINSNTHQATATFNLGYGQHTLVVSGDVSSLSYHSSVTSQFNLVPWIQ